MWKSRIESKKVVPYVLSAWAKTTNKKTQDLVQKSLPKVQKYLDNGGKYVGQIKEDGMYAAAILNVADGEIMSATFLARTGNELTNTQHLLQGFSDAVSGSAFWEGKVVVIGEIRSDEMSLEDMQSCFKSTRTKPIDEELVLLHERCYVVCHDIVPFKDFDEGLCDIPYLERLAHLQETLCFDASSVVLLVTTLESGSYFTDIESMQAAGETLVQQGEEGAVFKNPMGLWVAGERNENAIKYVGGVDYDLEVTDVIIGDDPGKPKVYGKPAKIMVKWRQWGEEDGRITELPVTIPSDKLREHFAGDWQGTIVHVHGMCISTHGNIRLVTLKRIRVDKDQGQF